MKFLYIFITMIMIVSGLVATPSSMNPMSETALGWYNIQTGQVKCWDKWTCLHEAVHEYDWENGGEQISETREFNKAVAEYYMTIYEKNEDDMTYLESFMFTFPGIFNDLSDDGWGGFQELYAELFTITERFEFIDMPTEFVKLYDKEEIYKLWEQYPNFWSRL